MAEAAVSVQGLSKWYRLNASPYKTLRDDLHMSVGQLWRALVPRRAVGSPGANDPSSGIWALKDVSFEVARGEVLGIIGRNGAGKSTLLKILSRITAPSAGCARIRGRVGSLLEVGTGFHSELTGRENIYLNGAILGMRKSEIAARFDEIVEFAGLARFIDTPVKHYSTGMYLRLGFAVAAHLNCEVLFVDEVLAVGDLEFQRKCQGKMEEVAEGGRTVLLVSHNIGAVQVLCSRALLLDNGQVSVMGPVGEVVRAYADQARRIAAVPLAQRTDRRGHGRLRFKDFRLQGAWNSANLVGGEPARFIFTLEAREPQTSIEVAFALFDVNGAGVSEVSTKTAGAHIARIVGECMVECVFDRFPLLPGTFRVNLFCTSNGQIADWVLDAAQFEVAVSNFYASGFYPAPGYGSVAVDYRWEIHN